MTRAPSSKVGIVAALAAEARALGAARRAAVGMRSLADGSLVAVSGMGVEAAARSAHSLIEAGCGALASCGLAGGLDPQLRAGTIVVPQTLLFDGAPALNVAAAWRERLVHTSSEPLRTAMVGGRLLTSVRPRVSIAEKQDALRRTGAVAVDTESYAVAKIAAASDLPFLAVRVIVDTANDEVPSTLAEVASAQGRIDIGRLILAVVSDPASIAPLLRLSRRYGAARNSLRAVAREVARSAVAA